jgi:hypothetical protein
MTAEELKQVQETFERYRGNRVVAITISYEEWMRETAVSWTRRTSTTQELDEALKQYHLKGKTQLAGYAVRQAFEKWVVAHPIWWQSPRNKKSERYKSGIIQALHDEIQLIGSFRSVQQMANGNWEGLQLLRKAEKEILKSLFANRRLVYKNSRWKDQLSGAVNQIGLRTYTTTRAFTEPRVDEGGVRGAVHQIMGGQDPSDLFRYLGVGFDAFVGGIKTVLNLALGPIRLLKNIVDIAMLVNTKLNVKRERFMYSAGSADAALNGVMLLIDRDLAVTAVDTGGQVVKIVTGFCTGPLAPLATSVTELVGLMVNMSLYDEMRKEMQEGNQLLSQIQAHPHFNLNLFNTSPLLGCYFVVMADAAVWMNYDAAYWGLDGFMDEQARMYERSEVVRQKARALIRTSKCALSGTEYLGWEPTWSNNKMEYLGRMLGTRTDRLGGVDWLCGLRKTQTPSTEPKPRPLVRQGASRNLLS